MLKTASSLLLILSMLTTKAQVARKSLDQLINQADPAWPLVQKWIAGATNHVEVLPPDSVKAKDALLKIQVTTRSPMGALVYSSGGLLIDHGWIRILGSGHVKLNRTLPDWNKGKSFREFGEQPSFLLVADDAAGGFFAINGGGLGRDAGKVYYLAPDNLEWEPLELTYTEFLDFCFTGDLADFYKDQRWKDWKTDVEKLDGNKTYNFYPPLWMEEGKDINKVSRKPISVEEHYHVTLDMRKQLGRTQNGL